jgi:glycine cleavage system H protein
MSKICPDDRLFSKEHEWIKINDNLATMGISDHAQSSLGDIVYVELAGVGAVVKKGTPIGVLESVKAVSDIYAPISGTIKSVNQKVITNPEIINTDPYGEGWLLLIDISDQSEKNDLLDSDAYKKLVKEEAK